MGKIKAFWSWCGTETTTTNANYWLLETFFWVSAIEIVIGWIK